MAKSIPAIEAPRMLIGGELVEAASGETFETHNPATGEKIADIPRGSEQDVERAIEAGKEGYEVWHREYDARERGKLVQEFADFLREHADHLGVLDSADSGNPYSQMVNDTLDAADCAEIFGGSALEMRGDTIPVGNDTVNFTLRQPYGVVGRIIPYNHPMLFAGMKIAAPLVAGNSVVLKPPEQDCTAVMEMGRLLAEENIFPDGVVNIVSGFGEEAGAPIVGHPDIHKVGFIGSVPTGKIIQQQAAENVADLILELGGKNPCIVYPDADIENAINGAISGMNFKWSGQSCGSTSRLFLHESHYEEGLQLLKEKVEAIEPGNPLEEDTEMGCVISESQYEKVMEFIEWGKESDATLLTGGSPPEGEEFEDGFFVRPTVFADATMDMRITQEEIFGPVLSVLKWEDEEEVIAAANDVEFGLTASVFSNDISTALNAIKEIEAGYTWINDAGPHYWGAPFGGWKQSGIGQEEAFEEVLEHTRIKNVNINLGESELDLGRSRKELEKGDSPGNSSE